MVLMMIAPVAIALLAERRYAPVDESSAGLTSLAGLGRTGSSLAHAAETN